MISKWLILFLAVCAPLLQAEEGKQLSSSDLKGGARWSIYASDGIQDSVFLLEENAEAIARMSIVLDQPTSYAFAAKSRDSLFFLCGTILSEASAHARAGSVQLLQGRLHVLEETLKALGAPTSYVNYVSRLGTAAGLGVVDKKGAVEMLSVFQPILDEWSLSNSKEQQLMFQMGGWLMDLMVAASAEQYYLLHQPARLEQAATQFVEIAAPLGVLDSIAELRSIASRRDLGAREGKRAIELIRLIQQLLG